MRPYPFKQEVAGAEGVVDELELKKDMVRIMKVGCTAEYAAKTPRLNEGDELPDGDVIAIAMAGRDIASIAKSCLDEIADEISAMAAISPADFSNKNQYISALDAVAEALESSDWYDGMLDVCGVTTWANLKAACTPEAPE